MEFLKTMFAGLMTGCFISALREVAEKDYKNVSFVEIMMIPLYIIFCIIVINYEFF